MESLCDAFGLDHQIFTNKDWVKPFSENGLLKVDDRPVVNTLVPNVRGLALKDAMYLLENQGLKVKITGKQVGKVRQQSISPGVKARNGLVIELVVS